MADPIPLLQSLIRCPSVTPEPAGVFDIIEAALRPLGFNIERLRFEGDGSYPVDNLFATRGDGGPHLLFNGHTDVVPPGDASLWTSDAFAGEIRDGRIYGRGSADMKSGLAAFISAVADAPPTGRISIAITNDEEADGINGTAKLMSWATEQGHRFDFAIVGEPSATAAAGDSIKIGRRGSLNGRITVTGTQGHVAYPDRAVNPLPVAAAIVTALSGKLDDGDAQFPPSNLEFTSVDVGNRTTNVIPAQADLRFNVRFNSDWTPATLEQAIREGLDNVDRGDAGIQFDVVGRPSASFLSPLDGAVDLLSRTIADICGQAPELSTAGGTSDARFIAATCPVVELGLAGPTMHKADENVLIEDVLALRALYAAFLQRFLGGEK